MNYNFDFSVVTAVYNSVPFLPDTVKSLLNQSFGFSRIQLILVDDGSTDGSGAMCDSYQREHPDNIFVIHKANGGCSSARNEGMKYVQGKYVSFLDSDDCLSPNAMQKVYDFFETHTNVDVVSLPMYFFDGQTGEHLLNYKFQKGTRVIDLDAEPYNPQLAVTSAFIRAETLVGKSFDTQLKYAEDARLLQPILAEKRALGVVSDAQHLYRRRSTGEASLIQNSGKNIHWYTPYLKRFSKETLDVCEARYGTIPKFVQNTVMYDLQWRINQRQIPKGIMDEAEKESYRSLLLSLVRRIDDEVIANQLKLTPAQKEFLLYQKHKISPSFLQSKNGRICQYPGYEPFNLEFEKPTCDFFTVKNGMITIECSIWASEGFGTKIPELVAVANGKEYTSKPIDRKQSLLSMGKPIANRFGYMYQIPIPEPKVSLHITFFQRMGDCSASVKEIAFGRFFPISEKYKYMYADIAGRTLMHQNGELVFYKPHFIRLGREVRFLAELISFRRKRDFHAVIGRLLYGLLKPFQRKPIWLISDRNQVAGDNGEALFRYLTSLQLKDVRLYFTVAKSCPAYQELEQIGNVVEAKSFRHKMLFLLSEFNISSQADDDIITQFPRYDQPYRDIQSHISFVFLQHGVTKDDLSGWLNRYNRNFAGFVTAAKAEANSLRDCAYFYPDKVIWLTGFPRFDRLYHDEKRLITIMPTWRHAWVASSDPKTGVRYLKEGFTESSFYRFFSKLLCDRRLIDAAKNYGYTIQFLPHPLLQPHMHMFAKDPEVKFLPSNVTYREVFAESNLVLTDYSSVVFDFAYLRKPVVYTQFDREEFFSGEHTYVQGYFDYEHDGFGEVEIEYEKTVDRLIEYMKNGCELKDKYRERIDQFFAFNDQNNCRRVYEKIRELQKDR